MVQQHQLALQRECGETAQHQAGDEQRQPEADSPEQFGLGSLCHASLHVQDYKRFNAP
jgi:hypothetical protein